MQMRAGLADCYLLIWCNEPAAYIEMSHHGWYDFMVSSRGQCCILSSLAGSKSWGDPFNLESSLSVRQPHRRDLEICVAMTRSCFSHCCCPPDGRRGGRLPDRKQEEAEKYVVVTDGQVGVLPRWSKRDKLKKSWNKWHELVTSGWKSQNYILLKTGTFCVWFILIGPVCLCSFSARFSSRAQSCWKWSRSTSTGSRVSVKTRLHDVSSLTDNGRYSFQML